MDQKVAAPRVVGKIVQRPRLLEMMAAGAGPDCSLTLVSAPAGSGKTVLLAQRYRWLRERGAAVGWLCIDDRDNDPAVLRAGILRACWRATADRTVSAGAVPDRLWLIVDDAHRLVDRAALELFSGVLPVSAGRLHVTLGCRHDPPLALSRLALGDALSQVRADALAFDGAETRALLASHRLDVSDADVALLLERTEGWAAGLKLASLWMGGQDDPSAGVARFAGDQRPVADYLVSEVLSQQPEEARQLLLAAAVPGRLTVELAAELSGRTDAGAELDRLARDNALVFCEDGAPASYRLHTLLRSYLLAELGRRDAVAKRDLHTRSARWFARHGLVESALPHAVAGHDWASTGALLDSDGLRILLTSGPAAVEEALRSLPAAWARSPGTNLLTAAAALARGDLSTVRYHLSLAGPAWSHEDGRWRSTHAALALHQARIVGEVPADADRLLELTTDGVGYPASEVLGAVSRAIAQLSPARIGDAETELAEAAGEAERNGFALLALDGLAHLALASAARGEAVETAARAARAQTFGVDRGLAATAPMVVAHSAAGWAAWRSLRVEAADEFLTLAATVEQPSALGPRLGAHVLRTYLDVTGGRNTRAARRVLSRVWDDPRAPRSPRETAERCLTELRLAARSHDGAWMDEVLSRAAVVLADTGDLDIVRAFAENERGRTQRARHLLDPALAGERATVTSEIPAWLLAADLADANQQPARAHEALMHALRRAAASGVLIDFGLAGSRVKGLLSRQRGRFGRYEAFAGELITRLRLLDREAPGRPAGPEGSLTSRELDLLRDLPSMLSLGEIAEEHVVSLNTVKTHLKAIYRKLEANSRREAVDRARELGLL